MVSRKGDRLTHRLGTGKLGFLLDEENTSFYAEYEHTSTGVEYTAIYPKDAVRALHCLFENHPQRIFKLLRDRCRIEVHAAEAVALFSLRVMHDESETISVVLPKKLYEGCSEEAQAVRQHQRALSRRMERLEQTVAELHFFGPGRGDPHPAGPLHGAVTYLYETVDFSETLGLRRHAWNVLTNYYYPTDHTKEMLANGVDVNMKNPNPESTHESVLEAVIRGYKQRLPHGVRPERVAAYCRELVETYGIDVEAEDDEKNTAFTACQDVLRHPPPVQDHRRCKGRCDGGRPCDEQIKICESLKEVQLLLQATRKK